MEVLKSLLRGMKGIRILNLNDTLQINTRRKTPTFLIMEMRRNKKKILALTTRTMNIHAKWKDYKYRDEHNRSK